MVRDGHRCVRCDLSLGHGQFSLQHRLPRGMGGSVGANTAANLILLCGSATTGCHGWAESRVTEATVAGYRCPRWCGPWLWRVLRLAVYPGRAEWAQPGESWTVAEPHPDQGGAMSGSNYAQEALDALAAECPGLEPDLARLYALLVLTHGEGTTLRHVHDAWALWRNMTDPAHRSLISFYDLSRKVQELDREYLDAIHATARAVSDGRRGES